MTAHNVDEPMPIDRYDVASRLLDAAAQAALKGRYDRVQAHATRALVDTLTSPRHNPIPTQEVTHGNR